jgi:hypothetical protein
LDFTEGPFSLPETHFDPPNNTQHDVLAHVFTSNALHFDSMSIGEALSASQNPTFLYALVYSAIVGKWLVRLK